MQADGLYGLLVVVGTGGGIGVTRFSFLVRSAFQSVFNVQDPIKM